MLKFKTHIYTYLKTGLKRCSSPHQPLLHLLLHVNALLLQQLPLSKSPVDRLHRRLCTRRPLALQTGLLWVIKAEHVALPHDDTVP